MNRLISIIIPIYNAEMTLGACLDSVLAQTHKNIEVLCIVDGANDGSAAILYDYARSDERIVVIEQESLGPATARNAGLDRARGEYIAFVDADDKVAPNMCEVLLDILLSNEADLACCARYSVERDESKRTVRLDERFAPCMDIKSVDDLGLMLTAVPDFVWGKLYLRDIVRREEIRFPDGRVYGEDTVFLAKYLSRTKRVAFTEEPLYLYSAFSIGSITNTVSDSWYDIFENLKDIIYCFADKEELKPYLEELCIRYYDHRANAILRGGDRDFQLRYLRYSFEFLSANFPNWKPRMRKMTGIYHARIKTSIFLMKLVMTAPASVKQRAYERARGK